MVGFNPLPTMSAQYEDICSQFSWNLWKFSFCQSSAGKDQDGMFVSGAATSEVKGRGRAHCSWGQGEDKGLNGSYSLILTRMPTDVCMCVCVVCACSDLLINI